MHRKMSKKRIRRLSPPLMLRVSRHVSRKIRRTAQQPLIIGKEDLQIQRLVLTYKL